MSMVESEIPIERLGARRIALSGGGADLVTREVRVSGRADRLTHREAELLRFLSERSGRTITRDELLEQVFGYRPTLASRAVDTAISRLRAKIEVDPDRPAHVISVYSEGYRFEPAVVEIGRTVERIGVPGERTPLVGRGPEIGRVLAAVGAHRAVVLVGPGGVGKSRIAARVAADVVADRALFVPLAHASTAADVVAEVARIIAAPTDGARTLAAATAVVGRSLDARSATLLVLDSVEHLDGVASIFDTWLGMAPSLRILVASRAAVGIGGEHVVRVECLEVEAATTLYVERATAAGAVVTPADLDPIRLLVSSLDNLPLAIELAAARARSLTPVQMQGRLEARLRFLSGGPRDGDPRLASLRATLDWSWELLGSEERDALARLSVFPGRIGLAAAVAVLGPEAEERLTRLVSASLLQKTDGGCALLETVRVWATEKADELGIRAEAELAHAEHHHGWLVDVQPLLRPIDQAALDTLEPELGHLLVIPARMERVRPDLAVGVVIHLWELFQIRGPIDPYLATLDSGVRAARAAGDPRLPRVLRSRAMSLRLVGQAVEAERDLEEALSIETDPYLRAWLDGERAIVLADVGRFAEASALFERVIPVLRGRHVTATRGSLAALRILCGENGPDTEEMLRCSLAEAAVEWPRMAAAIRANLGVLLCQRGRGEEAEVHLVQAIAELKGLGAHRRLPSALMGLGTVRLGQGRFDDADALGADAEAIARLTGASRWLGLAIANRASLQIVFGDPAEGLRRLDEAEQILASIEDRWGSYLVDAYRTALLAASDRVGEAARCGERAAAQLATSTITDDGLLVAIDGHLAWAEVRAARAMGDDPEPARQRVLGARRSSPSGTGARFLISQLPADGG